MPKSDEEKNLKHYFTTTPYIRVIEMARTPDLDEFSKNALLVTATVLAVGLLGYIIFTLIGFLPM